MATRPILFKLLLYLGDDIFTACQNSLLYRALY